jgi:hypothetical protein
MGDLQAASWMAWGGWLHQLIRMDVFHASPTLTSGIFNYF